MKPICPGCGARGLSSFIQLIVPRRLPGAVQANLHTLYGGSTQGLEGYAEQIRPPTPRGYLHQLLAIAGWTSVRKLTRISADTLVLMGAADRLAPAANGHILKILLRRARLEILDAGHLLLLTHRELAASRIEQFLDAPLSSALAPTRAMPA